MSEPACRESVDKLDEVFADTMMTLRDRFKPRVMFSLAGRRLLA
jgi:hypothetical protein